MLFMFRHRGLFMNRVAVAQELVDIARVLSGERNLTAAEIREICPACADKMEQQGISSIPESDIVAAIKEASQKRADKWYDMPKGWTTESRQKFWDSLTGDRVHRITKCIKEMEGKVDDPGAFCGALASRVGYR
jgi:hypothetical protein